MTGLYRFLFLALLVLPLTACGEGYEMQLTNTIFPYGNQRTAGSGVAYVQAKMLPEKELKVVMPVQHEQAPQAVEPKPVQGPVMPPRTEKDVQSMEPVFHEKMKK